MLNTTRPMPREMYQRSLLEEMLAIKRWENRPTVGRDGSRLDRREMVLTLEESIRRGRLDDPGTREPLEILRGLGYSNSSASRLRGPRPTNWRGRRMRSWRPSRMRFEGARRNSGPSRSEGAST